MKDSLITSSCPVVIYLRRTQESASTEKQLQKCFQVANAKKWPVIQVFFEDFQGSQTWEALLERAKQNQDFSRVLVHTLCQIAEDAKTYYEREAALKAHGVSIYSIAHDLYVQSKSRIRHEQQA